MLLSRFTVCPGSQEITDIVHYDLVTSLQTMFPWCEYIVRLGWTDDGQFVWAQLLDRSQQRLELVLIPESQFERSSLPKIGSSFVDTNGPSNGELAPVQASSDSVHIVLIKTSVSR